MKILHVVNIFFTIPYFLGEQLNYFSKKKYELFVVCSPSDLLESYSLSHNFKYKQIPILRKISLVEDIKALINIISYINENKIEVVVGHTPKGALLAMISGFISRVPIRIYFRHGLVYETSKGFTRFILISMDRLTSFLATKIVCVSPSVYKQSLSDKLNVERKQIILHKGTCNGIDTKRFHRENLAIERISELRKKYSISEHKSFVIGYVGRLVRDKGIIELVEAFNQVQKQHLNCKLLLVGMMEERDSLPNEIITEIHNNSSIICTGYIDNQDMENYYALMNLFVLPSYREGFPTSVLEAASMELPILTTRATGCIDSIIENTNGCFVSHDKDEISQYMNRFINYPELCVEYGKNGRKFVMDNFRQDIIWEKIEKLYLD